MSTNKKKVSATKSADEKQVDDLTEVHVAPESKAFHQHFTQDILAVLFIVLATLTAASVVFFQQAKHSQNILNKQLRPLQTEFLQQSYLIKSQKLIHNTLLNFNVNNLATLQQELTLQSKKLSLLNSLNQASYQQWFDNNNKGAELIAEIEAGYHENDTVKNKVLIQLDTILDAIIIQLDKPVAANEQKKLLIQVQDKLASMVTLLSSLSLQTQQQSFQQLHNHLTEIFAEHYAKQLADLQQESQGLADIVRDLIRFEDLISKSEFLDKWQQQISLMAAYHQQLKPQQYELATILTTLINTTEVSEVSNKPFINQGKEVSDTHKLSLTLFILFVVALLTISVLLRRLWKKLRILSVSNASLINQALDGELDQEFMNESNSLSQQHDSSLISAESEQVINKIIQESTNQHNKVEVVIESDITAEETLDQNKAEQVSLDNDVIESISPEQLKAQWRLSQQGFNELYLQVVKQQLFFGINSISPAKEHSNSHLLIKGDCIYQAYQHGRELISLIEQVKCHQNIQSGQALLTLSDSNIITLLQATLMNQHDKLMIQQNTVSVNFDDKILAEVNLDAELFSELFKVFIDLLFSQQTEVNLALSIELIDKNVGQQKVLFSGKIKGAGKIQQLPSDIVNISDTKKEVSDQVLGYGLAEYFNVLLDYQHGNDLSASLTEDGYQLNFTLPLAVSDNKSAANYPAISLPYGLTNIDKEASRLSAKYLPMPMAVLLGVLSPISYQRLQLLIEGMGLQVTIVSCESLQQKYWHSGVFSVLITELNIQPFITFTLDEASLGEVALPRGIFSLSNTISFVDKPEAYTFWSTGELNSKSSVKELLVAMKPWLKERESISCAEATVIQAVSDTELSSESFSGEKAEIKITSAESVEYVDIKQSASFDFQRYLQHQGSAELAFYMLDEYTAENTTLVDNLAAALALEDNHKAEVAIHALHVNSKILAADELLQLCQHWQELLAKQALDKNGKLPIKLLEKTKQAVSEISKYAEIVA